MQLSIPSIKWRKKRYDVMCKDSMHANSTDLFSESFLFQQLKEKSLGKEASRFCKQAKATEVHFTLLKKCRRFFQNKRILYGTLGGFLKRTVLATGVPDFRK